MLPVQSVALNRKIRDFAIDLLTASRQSPLQARDCSLHGIINARELKLPVQSVALNRKIKDFAIDLLTASPKSPLASKGLLASWYNKCEGALLPIRSVALNRKIKDFAIDLLTASQKSPCKQAFLLYGTTIWRICIPHKYTDAQITGMHPFRAICAFLYTLEVIPMGHNIL